MLMCACVPSGEKVLSAWGLAWPTALSRCLRMVEFLRGLGWADNG